MLQKNGIKLNPSGSNILAGNLKLSLFLAFKSIIRGNKWALVLLVAVMAFSFINLVFVSSLISGIMVTLDNQMIDYVYGDIVVAPMHDSYYIERSSTLEKQVAAVPGVAAVTSRIDSSAFIEYRWKEKLSQFDRGRSGNWEVVAIEPDREVLVTDLHNRLIEGEYLDGSDRSQILLGAEIAGGSMATSADFLTLGGARVGEKVRLTYPNGIQREYTIKGIIYAREMNRADRCAMVTRDEMLSVLGRTAYADRSSQILVRAEESVDENGLIASIQGTGIQAEVKSWREYGGAASSIVSTFDIIGSLIGGVGLVIASIVMFIVIYINVLSRKRQIGILRAIGIPEIAIIGSYIFQAFFLTVAGTIVGWLLVNFGLLPYFRFNPLDLPLGLVSLNVPATALLSSILGLATAGILAGLIPAWTIMRQSIINIVWGN